jgi:protein TonB
MKRLLPAALIALVCHGLIFLLQPIDTTTPPRLKAARRPVNINLAHFVPTAPKVQKQAPKPKPQTVAPPPPKVRKQPPRPRPKPKPRLQPQIKKLLPKPKPEEPQPVAPAPVPEKRPEAVDEALRVTPHSIESAQAAAEVAAVEDPGPPQQVPLVAATPLYAHKPEPRYPRSAKRRGHQGTVLLSVHVSTTGRVDDLKVKTSSGFTVLDKAALEAVRTWRFESGRRGDRPVAMWVEVPIQFKLQ